MLIQYTETGKIVLIQSTPIDEQVVKNIMSDESSGKWIRNDGVALPEIAFFTPSGEPILDNNGEQIVASPGIEMPVVTSFEQMIDVAMGDIIDRPMLPGSGEVVSIKADGKDAFKLDCKAIQIDGEVYEIPSGKMTFVTKDAGTYRFQSVFPYQEWFCEVTAS